MNTYINRRAKSSALENKISDCVWSWRLNKLVRSVTCTWPVLFFILLDFFFHTGPATWRQQWLLGDFISQSKSKQQKAVASVTAGAYQIRSRFWLGAVRRSVGGLVGGTVSEASPGDFKPLNQNSKKEKSCHVWHCLSLECFDSLKQRQSSLDFKE